MLKPKNRETLVSENSLDRPHHILNLVYDEPNEMEAKPADQTHVDTLSKKDGNLTKSIKDTWATLFSTFKPGTKVWEIEGENNTEVTFSKTGQNHQKIDTGSPTYHCQAHMQKTTSSITKPAEDKSQR